MYKRPGKTLPNGVWGGRLMHGAQKGSRHSQQGLHHAFEIQGRQCSRHEANGTGPAVPPGAGSGCCLCLLPSARATDSGFVRSMRLSTLFSFFACASSLFIAAPSSCKPTMSCQLILPYAVAHHRLVTDRSAYRRRRREEMLVMQSAGFPSHPLTIEFSPFRGFGHNHRSRH